MNAVPLLGAGCGAGLLLIARGVRARHAPLAVTLLRMQRGGRSVADVASSHDGGGAGRRELLAAATAIVTGHLGRRIEVDLRTMEISPDRLAIEKLATALSLAAITVALVVVLAVFGSPVAPGAVLALVAAVLAIGFVTPDLALRSRATARRAAFRHALSSYLDLVTVLLAGGAGLQTALDAAAAAGDGWAFSRIRGVLIRARTTRRPTFECLAELGDLLDVAELRDIAATVRLAGEHGARIKNTLTVRAASLRAAQLSRIEADANAATERLGLPTVLMFLAFVVLLAYPATRQISASL